ncbi:hypothetical protein Scep_013115 [Stephania cephalantha]|uniref:Uncharacterized protein n=1 Tax=Stephania cephalantha TaxID=152367 RepID=A0AAP0JGT8_9MAGN
MCYVGKATKIFIFIVTVLVVVGLVVGFGLIRHHNKAHKCSGAGAGDPSCYQPPPPPGMETPPLIPSPPEMSAPGPGSNGPQVPALTTPGPAHA